MKMTEPIEGLRLTGNYVKTLADKNFTVMRIQKVTIVDTRTQKEKQLYEYTVKLANGAIRSWLPCQKAKQTMADMWGDLVEDQIGKKGLFFTVIKDVFGEAKDIVYVK